mmetsp:Transcript_158794/g.505585  ORF Transcript_158794/g.505585 Transcript_158794/m.505585 type:complete len:214 (+) Transcript_158794:1063-1704(+)
MNARPLFVMADAILGAERAPAANCHQPLRTRGVPQQRADATRERDDLQHDLACAIDDADQSILGSCSNERRFGAEGQRHDWTAMVELPNAPRSCIDHIQLGVCRHLAPQCLHALLADGDNPRSAGAPSQSGHHLAVIDADPKGACGNINDPQQAVFSLTTRGDKLPRGAPLDKAETTVVQDLRHWAACFNTNEAQTAVVAPRGQHRTARRPSA